MPPEPRPNPVLEAVLREVLFPVRIDDGQGHGPDPGSAEGDQVVVQADDGGLIDLESVVARKVLDERGVLEFRFTSTLEGGVYRITLRNGFDEKRLEFWGGSEPGGAVTAAVP